MAETVAASPHATAADAFEHEQLGHWDAAARQYALSFRAAVLEGDVAQAADSLRGQARVLIQEERFDEAEELVELSREIAERSGFPQSAARAINVLGIIRYRQRDWAGAREHYARARELALDVGDDDLAGLASQNAGVVANLLGDPREARTLYLESIGSFVRSGNSANALIAYNNLGMATADLNEWLEAEIYFSRGIEIAERLSQSPLLARLYGNRAEPLIHIGELDQARVSLQKAETAAMAVGDRLTLAEVERWRAVIARVSGDRDAAARHLAASLEIASEPSPERAEALRELGALHEASADGAAACAAFQAAAETFRIVGLVRAAELMDDRARSLSQR
jgi:tetratricopeptide (TPR) repeat protein